MQIITELGAFYSRGDEARLFNGLHSIRGVSKIRGVGRDIVITLNVSRLTREGARDLVALFRRYRLEMPALKPLSEKKRFQWLVDPDAFWHEAMFSTKPHRSEWPISMGGHGADDD